MAGTTVQSKQSSNGQNGLHLADAACRAKLNRLSKKGGIAHHWKTVGGMLLGVVIAFVLSLGLDVGMDAPDISEAKRGWAKLMFLIARGLIPFFVIGAAWFALQAIRSQVSATFRLECPRCRATHELSTVHRRRFELTCPACYTLVRGSAESHSTRVRCDYCELEYFDASGSGARCPSCRRSKPGATAKCPQCSHAVPKGVVCCLHCGRWLGEPLAGFGSGTTIYDVTQFSSKLARTYAVELARLMLSVTEFLEAVLASVTDVRTLDPGTTGRICGSLSEPTDLLPKLALAAEWIRRPGGVAVEPLPASVVDVLVRMEAALKRFCDGGLPLRKALSAVGTARRSVTSQC